MSEQRLYLPHLGLVVLIRPIPAASRPFVGAVLRIELIDQETVELLRRFPGYRVDARQRPGA